MDLVFSGWSGVTVLFFYGLMILGVGLFAYFKNKGHDVQSSVDEYYLGGRGLGLLVLFFTFLATQYSGNTMVGMAPKAYRLGFPWVQSIAFMVLAVSGFLLFAPRLYPLSKKFKFVTPSDWLDFRFNKSKRVTILATLLLMYALANFVLAQFVAIGQAVSGLTGGTIPYQVGVVYFVIIMLAYSWLGGMRAVAYVDFMQGVILTLGIVVLIAGTFICFGGLDVSTNYLVATELHKVTVPSFEVMARWISLLVLFGLGTPLYPHAIQRVFAAKNVTVLKKSIINMIWMPFVLTASVMVVGLIGIKAFPGLSTGESEQLVGMMANVIAAKSTFFYVTMILFFGGVVSAIISTADSALLSLSSMVSKDLYGRFINPKADDKQKIKAGKLTGIVIVLILLAIAWNPPATLYQILVIKFELLVQVAPAFMLSMYWKRLDAKPVFAGMLAGSSFAVIMAFMGVKTIYGFYAGVWGLLLNLFICLVWSSIIYSQKLQKTKALRVTA